MTVFRNLIIENHPRLEHDRDAEIIEAPRRHRLTGGYAQRTNTARALGGRSGAPTGVALRQEIYRSRSWTRQDAVTSVTDGQADRRTRHVMSQSYRACMQRCAGKRRKYLPVRNRRRCVRRKEGFERRNRTAIDEINFLVLR